MHKISGTTITLKQGDTFVTKVNLLQRKGDSEPKPIVPDRGSKLRFVAKRKLGEDYPVVLEKEVDLQTMTLRIESEQTKSFKLSGRSIELVYDLELTYPTGDVDTLISNAKFIIVPEVD